VTICCRSPKSKAKNDGHFLVCRSTSRPKIAAVENIDIGDSLGSETSVNIDIFKGDIDPALAAQHNETYLF